MNITKSKLKELIIEVAKKHSLDSGQENALPLLNEGHDLSGIDEEEREEWNSMIEDDMHALQGTLDNAPKEILSAGHEELIGLLGRLMGKYGEPSEDAPAEEELEGQ